MLSQLTILLLATLAAAAPSSSRRQATTTSLTFTGAGAQVQVQAPVDGSTFQLRKGLSLFSSLSLSTSSRCLHILR